MADIVENPLVNLSGELAERVRRNNRAFARARATADPSLTRVPRVRSG